MTPSPPRLAPRAGEVPRAGALPTTGLPPAAVLFDMDGLLIDTEPVWFDVETQLLAEFGAPWSAADHAELVGTSAAFASAFLARRLDGRLSVQQVSETILLRMAERLSRTPQLQPGVRQLIEELDDAGTLRALVSSSARVLVDAVLDGLSRTASLRFDVVITADDVTHAKPHPEPYLAAAARLGVDPTACVALEDSPTGVASANAAGAMVVAVPSVTTVEPADRRIVLGSLADVDLAFLRRLFTVV